MAYIPHTESDIKAMLDTISLDNIDQLFKEIPQELRIKELNKSIVPSAISEMEAAIEFRKRAFKDIAGACFIGAGAYEHHIPAAVWQLVGRGEFLTAYTPYQAEASQGGLQLLYEFQTMMASLMGLDVANASLYEAASGLAEAVLMAVRCNRKSKSRTILLPSSVHPHYREVLQSIVAKQGITVKELSYCVEQGATILDSLKQYQDQDITALVIPQPNFFGTLENVDQLTNWAHQKNAFVIGVVNPLAMALLKEPGRWGEQGADIVCGEGQPLGVSMSSGGPYFGFLCCKQALVRQMPGRLVGRTVDMEGKPGFVLTLQAREQHIRRSKATSNICTNQGLLVSAATIYMSLMGPQGLKQIAKICHYNTKYLVELLNEIDGVEVVFKRPFFHEIAIRLQQPVEHVIRAMADNNIQAGYALGEYYTELHDCMLVCVTETKSKADIEYYAKTLATILQQDVKKNFKIEQQDRLTTV